MAYIALDGPDDEGKFTARLIAEEGGGSSAESTVESKADLERLTQEWGVDEVHGAGLLSIHEGEP